MVAVAGVVVLTSISVTVAVNMQQDRTTAGLENHDPIHRIYAETGSEF